MVKATRSELEALGLSRMTAAPPLTRIPASQSAIASFWVSDPVVSLPVSTRYKVAKSAGPAGP